MSFWDASALVPLCVNEATSYTARKQWHSFSSRTVWCETVVEISSALSRLDRQEMIDSSNLMRAERILAKLERIWTVIEFETRIVDLARTFPKLYGLKAGDSLQLAAALVWCREYPKNEDFVSGDARLSKAAESAGFRVHYLE